MHLTLEQTDALLAIQSWFNAMVHGDVHQPPAFLLVGPAGSGKTSLAKQVELSLDVHTGYAAYTGKAAHVLRQKGCDATTIHSLIYHPQERSSERLRDLEAQVEAAWEVANEIPPGEDYRAERQDALAMATAAEREVDAERARCKRPGFQLNPDSAIRELDLLIVDEVSMVGKRVGQDLELFGVPILVLGDKAQLPPVRDGGYFIDREPDFRLEEVHRQAAGSPVLALATDVRLGHVLNYGTYGTSAVLPLNGGFKIQEALLADQIIVGKNATRRAVNEQARRYLRRTSEYPEMDERVVCLRNDNEQGFLNGSLWTVVTGGEPDRDDEMLVTLASDAVGGEEQRLVTTSIHAAPFRGQDVPVWKVREAQLFDYGYAITCHKAQGSQWPHVVIVDQSHVFGRHANRWLYTAITRAEERVTIVR